MKTISERIWAKLHDHHGDLDDDFECIAHDAEDIEKHNKELKEGYECALSHIKTLNDGVLMSQNIWDKVIVQADDLLNDTKFKPKK